MTRDTTRDTHIPGTQPDGRQTRPGEVPSRFRPRYRTLSPSERELHDAIKAKAVEMEHLYLQVLAGRYNSLAMTSLEESVMWIIKQLTA